MQINMQTFLHSVCNHSFVENAFLFFQRHPKYELNVANNWIFRLDSLASDGRHPKQKGLHR